MSTMEKTLVERLKDRRSNAFGSLRWEAADLILSLSSRVKELESHLQQIRTVLEEFCEAAQYDATMEGPKFKGWNRSQLERARKSALSLLGQGKMGVPSVASSEAPQEVVSGQQQAAMEQAGWQWWAGRDEERFTEGPFNSREEAIEEGRGQFDSDGFYIVEALQENPIDLGHYIDADRFLEHMCEAVDENCSDPDGDPVTDGEWNREHEKDLEQMLKETVRAWQAKHNICIHSWLFQNSRKQEWIEPLPEPDSDRASGDLSFPDEPKAKEGNPTTETEA